MSIKSYKKNGNIVEAVKFDGYNDYYIFKWTNGKVSLVDSSLDNKVRQLETVKTIGNVGDLVVKDQDGEFYFCKPSEVENVD